MWQASKNIYHLIMAILATIFYGFASKKFTVIGVTGTDGKTTTTHLIYHILNTAGKKVSMISSLGARINGEKYDTGFHVTTPSSWKLQRFIKKATEAPAEKKFLVLEVTSHALDQYRVWGIEFTIGVLTNVTHEHLDYHKTWERYVGAKTKLLKYAKIAVANKDDESFRLINSKFEFRNSKLITYGIKSGDITPRNFPFKTKIVGEFNKYNILAGIAACKSLGIDNEDIKKAVLTFGLPVGRLEVVHDDKFMVMIDFAHTPNSFEKVLPTVKSMTHKRLIHVFGCAGKRDGTKRPLMGEICAKYADVIVLTAEDPRREDINEINRQIMEGVQRGKNNPETYSIADRKEAIAFAISLARPGDTVLLTGKSHEQSMNYTGREEPWSEYEAVENALKKL